MRYLIIGDWFQEGRRSLMWVFICLKSRSRHTLQLDRLLNVGVGSKPHTEFRSRSWASSSCHTERASGQNGPQVIPQQPCPLGLPTDTVMGVNVSLRTGIRNYVLPGDFLLPSCFVPSREPLRLWALAWRLLITSLEGRSFSGIHSRWVVNGMAILEA